MRWHHPLYGLIPPSEFIQLAEETGLITAMGAWALQQACKDAMTWPAHVGVSGYYQNIYKSSYFYAKALHTS